MIKTPADQGQSAYPFCSLTIIGIWKALGAIVLLAPRLPRRKESAHAGILFSVTGAARIVGLVTHFLHGTRKGIAGAGWQRCRDRGQWRARQDSNLRQPA